MPLFEHVTDPWAQADRLVARRYGVIQTRAARLESIHLRPWPKLISWPEIFPVGFGYHARGPADVCRLYYNQPRGYSNFIAVKYVASTRGTSLATVLAAMAALDVVARLKGTDALLCDVSNTRISDRLLVRQGWAPLARRWFHRNYIKRFYGVYPEATATPPAPAAAAPLPLDSAARGPSPSVQNLQECGAGALGIPPADVPDVDRTNMHSAL